MNSKPKTSEAGVSIKLRIECVAGAYFKKECVRVVAMDEDATLRGLHEVIQDAVSFDRDHLYDFFGSTTWHRNQHMASKTGFMIDERGRPT